MNIVLWILQIVLGLKFASVAYTHGIRRDPTKMQQGYERFGTVAGPLLTLTALCTLVGALGLILPAVTGILPWLTAVAAGLLALMMLLSIGFHVACREQPNIWVSLVLFVLAAFVCYGRWILFPL